MGKAYYKLDEINSLRDEFSKMLYDFFDKKDNGVLEYDFIPPIDVIEKEDRLILEMEIPGIDKEEIELSFSNDVLSIKGVKKNRVSEEKDLYHRIERNYGKFHRNITIPYQIDESNIVAEVKRGILIIFLFKKLTDSNNKIKINFED